MYKRWFQLQGEQTNAFAYQFVQFRNMFIAY